MKKYLLLTLLSLTMLGCKLKTNEEFMSERVHKYMESELYKVIKSEEIYVDSNLVIYITYVEKLLSAEKEKYLLKTYSFKELTYGTKVKIITLQMRYGLFSSPGTTVFSVPI